MIFKGIWFNESSVVYEEPETVECDNAEDATKAFYMKYETGKWPAPVLSVIPVSDKLITFNVSGVDVS